MLNRPDHINTLPAEIILAILFYLTPETVSTLSSVSNFFYTTTNDNLFWKNKFARHFSHRFNIISALWRPKFLRAYQDEYKALPVDIRKKFSLAKEGDIRGLIQANLQQNDLFVNDTTGRSILGWIKNTKDPVLLDYIYLHIIIKEHTVGLTVDTEKKDGQGRTILHWAIACRQPAETINLLILQGADVNTPNELGSNPLRIAAHEGLADIIALLINHGADVDARSTAAGATALFLAVINGHRFVVDVLLEQGANTTISLRCLTPYHKTFPVAVGDTPLHAAIKLGYIHIVQSLLNNNADINALNKHGSNALRIAAMTGHADIAELLLKHGADVNDRSPSSGATALFFAVENNHQPIVDVLLGNNADITIPLRTKSGYHLDFNVDGGDTPHQAALKLGHIAIAQSLLRCERERAGFRLRLSS